MPVKVPVFHLITTEIAAPLDHILYRTQSVHAGVVLRESEIKAIIGRGSRARIRIITICGTVLPSAMRVEDAEHSVVTRAGGLMSSWANLRGVTLGPITGDPFALRVLILVKNAA